MRYALKCVSVIWHDEEILDKYPIIHKYNPVIDYPYPNKNMGRITIEVADLIDFFYDIGYPIILDDDVEYSENKLFCLTIYDDCL